MTSTPQLAKKSKILVVDDSKTFTHHITSLISQETDFEIQSCNDSTKAVDMAKEWMPDVLLTDFEMPDITGPQLCRLFREDQSLNPVSIIMLTSHEGDGPLIEAIENGADDYICKSSSKDVVMIKIKSMIRKTEMSKDLIRAKQLEAIHLLIVTANHRLNNLLMVSNSIIAKSLRGKLEHEDALEQITETNSRIQDVLKQIKSAEHIENDDYIEGIKMMKLD